MRLSLPFGALLLIGCVTEPEPVTITFCDPIVGGTIAIRNDEAKFGLPGRWITVDAPDGKTFSFTAPRRLSIAFTELETSNVSDLRVFQLTSDELPKLNCVAATTGDARTYTGTITGLVTGKTAQVGLGTAQVSRGNGSFTLRTTTIGASDLVALMRSGPSVEKFIVRRDLDLQSGSVLDPIDFTSGESGAPRFNTAAVSGAGSEPVTISYGVVTRGTPAGIPVPATDGILTLASLPANLQKTTDFYVVGASAVTGAAAVLSRRSVSVRFVNPDDRLLTLGPSLDVASMTFKTQAGPSSLRFTLPVQSAYPARADLTVNQVAEGIFLGVTMTITQSYRGTSSTWDFETPDPSALTMRAVRLDPNASTSWIAYVNSGDISSLFLGTSTSELTVREALAEGAVGAGPIYHSRINNSFPERSCRLCLRKLPF